MRKFARRTLLTTTAVTGSLVLGTMARAQDQAAPDPAEEQAPDSEIVVTGSLIRNANLEQTNPVNVTTSDQIELKQANVAEEVLREVPGIVPSVGSAVNNGNNGGTFVDLRGLGANRNIVLLDGNRIVPTGTAGTAGVTDLNNIPLALISRVDALTGAAVTTYGADAITGVVNFITRRDFAGLEATASNQLTEQGDGNFFRVDTTIGANFDDGRGNAVLSVGYQKSDPVYQGARDFSIEQLSSYSGGATGSGTAVPSRFSGTRPLLANGRPNATAAFTVTGTTADGTPIIAPVAGGANNFGVRQIDPATGTATASLFAPFNFNPYNIFQTPFKRYNVFAQANYEASDEVEVYARGLFSKNQIVTIVAPSGAFGGAVNINLNNPFLPVGLRNQFCGLNTAPVTVGVTAAGAAAAGQTSYVPLYDQATCDAAALATGPSDPRYRTVTVTLNRRAVEAGPRIDDFTSTVFDYRIGARGQITDSIDWDINGSYGESENLRIRRNYTLQSRFRQGSLVNSVNGVPTCQDPSNGCVPINLFGNAGTISQEAADFLRVDATSSIKSTLAQARGVISGDLGFSSPWAEEPLGFAVGAEYRKYTNAQRSDVLAGTAGELGGAGGALPTYTGGYDVYEGYAELILPVIADKPLFHSLTLEGGARYSHYKIDTAGTNETFTYKVGGSWEPTPDIKVRGNFSHAVRSPNIIELFFPANTGLTNLAVDPCAGTAPLSNANLRAVCIAQGAPATTIGTITNPTAAQANATASGNVNLDPEEADTYTFGVVLQPAFIPRFSISADYYNIKVTDVIGAPVSGDLVTACFGNLTAASASDPDCTVIRRNPFTGGLDGDPATTPGLFAPLSNLGVLKTDGIDVVANYVTDLGFGDLALSFVGNWTNHSRFKATPTSLDRDCAGYYSVNCSFSGSIQPEFQFSQRTTLSLQNIDISLLWRWIDEVNFEPQQFADDVAAAQAAGCEDILGADPDACVVDPAFRRIPADSFFDLTFRFNVSDNMTFTATVQNLLDNKPPIVGNTLGSTTFNSGNTYPATYDALGRRYAISAKLRF